MVKLESKFRVSFAVVKQTKNGSVCLGLCVKHLVMNLTVCVDIDSNLGPQSDNIGNTQSADQPSRALSQGQS